MRSIPWFAIAVAAACAPSAALGQSGGADSAAVGAIVTRFHQALRAGDSTAVLALLADDAVILESGGVETKEEYRGHHLPGDIAFLRAGNEKAGTQRITIQGDAAWAASTSTMEGAYEGKALNLASAELMVLSRASGAWRIRAVHWSTRPRPRSK
jgi:ketosteroid isomerase-like protein